MRDMVGAFSWWCPCDERPGRESTIAGPFPLTLCERLQPRAFRPPHARATGLPPARGWRRNVAGVAAEGLWGDGGRFEGMTTNGPSGQRWRTCREDEVQDALSGTGVPLLEQLQPGDAL